jgi:hypothetical protein
MPIKTYRPTTQTLRFRTTIVNDDITTKEPYKPLLEPKQRTGGRRNSGDITMRFIGGGHKRKLRIIDFKRDKAGIPATVETIEYDPNRSSRAQIKTWPVRSRPGDPPGGVTRWATKPEKTDGSARSSRGLGLRKQRVGGTRSAPALPG